MSNTNNKHTNGIRSQYNAIHSQEVVEEEEEECQTVGIVEDGIDGGTETANDDSSSEAVVITVEDAIEHLAMGPFQYIMVLAAGLCFAADAMEIVLLSFLSVVLQEQWQLTPNETALITSVLFLGASVGTLVLGPLADQWGRRPVFLCTAWIISIASLISATMSHYYGLLTMISIIGFGIGGLTVPFDILAEFLPSAHRGSNLLMIEYCWTFGVLLVVFMAQHTLSSQHGGGHDYHHHHHAQENNWRYLVLGCASVCCGSAVLGTCLVPESPRWLVAQGRSQEAVKVLQRAAKWNGLVRERDMYHPPTLPQSTFPLQEDDSTSDDDISEALHPLLVLFLPSVQLIDAEPTSDTKSSFADLFQPRWRRTTLFLWGTWAAFAFGYYGAIQAITRVFAQVNDSNTNSTNSTWYNETILAANNNNNNSTSTIHFDYQAIYISSAAEFVGTTLAILSVDRIGRIPFQMVSYASAGIAVCLLCVVSSRQPPIVVKVPFTFDYQRWTLIGLGFITRVFEMSATCVTWVSTAEILTTEVRTTGHAAANAVARIGALLSPFLIEGSTRSLSLWQIGVVMLVVHGFAVLCVSQLPETKGRRLGHAESDELQLEPNSPLTQYHRQQCHPITNDDECTDNVAEILS